MSKLTGLIYSLIIRAYQFVPLKRPLCLLLKMSGVPISKFYRDLKFEGPFRVNVDASNSFVMHHYGGTIENEAFWKGLFNSWENDTGWIWVQLCRACPMIFDVGANTGIYSLVAKTVNPRATVHAFEPSKHIYSKLVHNNSVNGYDIHCHQIAVSDFDGEQVFYDTDDSNTTSASLSPKKLKELQSLLQQEKNKK